MDITKDQLRAVGLHEFRLGHSAAAAHRNICQTMGHSVVSERTIRNWFARFREGDYQLEDKPHPGPTVKVNLEQLLELIEDDPRLTTTQLGAALGCSHMTIATHLHELGKSYKWGRIVPHSLTEEQAERRVDLCMTNLTSHRNESWLINLVTGDESWIHYSNNPQKRQWLGVDDPGTSTVKPSHFDKAALLCVFWNCRGIVHYELLTDGKTVTSTVYVDQLERVRSKLSGVQDRVYFLDDNAKPHRSQIVRKKILEFGWIAVPQPAYSPDIAPSDYHLFRSLKNYLRDKSFKNQDEIKFTLDQFFASQSPDSYSNAIKELPNRWREVIEADGEYIGD